VSQRYAEGDLIAYVGAYDPELDLYDGQPGVVIDVGPTPLDISVEMASGPALSIPPWNLARISLSEYRERGDRMRRHWHPLREETITPLDIHFGTDRLAPEQGP
jgi:hypothetical protein